MPNILRRYLALTITVAVVVTGIQAVLVGLVLHAYRQNTNRRSSEVGLSTQALLLEGELQAGRDWPAIQRRMQARFEPLTPDSETAVYDDAGTLLMRSTGLLDEIPPSLSIEDRASLTERVSVLKGRDRIGVVAVGTMRAVGGKPVYLVRVNPSLRNALPSLLKLGIGALALPMLLLGLTGAISILRITGQQVAKVDRVLRMMASGDLSARLSLPVDEDTAGVVLSFNRMAEKVEETIEKLRRSDGSRRQLLADVTHELNTPLTSVLGYLETLCMEDLPLSEERRKRLLGIAYEEAVNLRALIEDLTTLSRLDAEGLPIERARVGLSSVAEKVVRRLSHLAEKRGVPLETDLAAGVEVRGDAQRLDQVVRNLVENALRHTQSPGTVKVSVRREGQTAVLEVRDQGAGIPPEDLQRLGQRFLRLDRSRARDTGGRGLGLAITIGLVETHGGKVHFESAQGSGTLVRVTLPLLLADTDTPTRKTSILGLISPAPKAPETAPATPITTTIATTTATTTLPRSVRGGPTEKIGSGRPNPATPSAKEGAARKKRGRSRRKH